MKTETDLNLLELLEYIHPAACDYTEWLSIGMALKEAGYTCADWDEWSKRDPERYHAGEAWRKWDSFKGAATPITAGTLVQMAKDHGWEPARSGHELDWGDEIGGKDSQVVVKKGWLESIDIKEPETWDPVEQLLTYLDVLFTDEENVGYVTEVWEKDGRILPTSGSYDRTAVQLKAALKHCKGDIGAVIGDTNPDAGAWIRFNPLDGKGVRNENVTDLRYALVESDETDLGQQNAILRELELPIAALVYSGGKSLHAIVHIDAPNYEEYRKRVEFLYDICRKNGLQPDKQNKNPSRLSRMPGVMRKGHKQFLLGTNIGKKNWEEWREWIESVDDDLPPIEEEKFGEIIENDPELIRGVLRQGRKMMVAGPSKASKTFALIGLAVCISEGLPWMGFQCKKGKVLYLDFELEKKEYKTRLNNVRRALQAPETNPIAVWNLRGRTQKMEKLIPKLIWKCRNMKYDAIILDPIYKVFLGDENSSEQVGWFCNQLDRICTELGTSVIYCHHHSKGAQGGKASMDRASGSGVFARDADALLDMIVLEPSNDVDLKGRVPLRIEGTLREFPSFEPFNIWFEYPIHRLDDTGELASAKPRSEIDPRKKGGEATQSRWAKEREKHNEELQKAYEKLRKKGPVTTADLQKATSAESRDTIKRWIDNCPFLERNAKTGIVTEYIDADEPLPDGW